jgi:hypothetical protein
MSWLKGFKAKEGNYGLMVRIVAKSAETATSNDTKEEIANKILNETSESDFFTDGKILTED